MSNIGPFLEGQLRCRHGNKDFRCLYPEMRKVTRKRRISQRILFTENRPDVDNLYLSSLFFACSSRIISEYPMCLSSALIAIARRFVRVLSVLADSIHLLK